MSDHMEEIILVTTGNATDTHVFDSEGNRMTRVQKLTLNFAAGFEDVPGSLTQVVSDEEGNVKTREENGERYIVERTVHFDRVIIKDSL